jgi:hypothetical protein
MILKTTKSSGGHTVLKILPEQMELRRELPVVVGNVDYRVFRERLERIDEILVGGGLEADFLRRRLAVWLAGLDREPSGKAQARYERQCRQALRCNIARQLTEKEYRRFTRRLADSPVLQWFCRVDRLEVVRVPSKSALERYDKLAPEAEVRALVDELTRQAAGLKDGSRHPLGLEEALGLEVYWADTTCVKANIHFPTDWVLMRDAVRTLMKAVLLIRGQGLKQRMEEPEVFLRRMNRLCIAMTQNRRQEGSRKARKRTLRQMKRLSGVIARHARRYRDMLEKRWGETEWTEVAARQVIGRIDRILKQLPTAMKQAHERLIGGRPVKNEEKILSLYEPNIHVIVRGKSDAEVEFGNTLFLGEQREGYVVDWKLVKEVSPGDGALLRTSLARTRQVLGQNPLGVGADRAFDGPETRKVLEIETIFNGVCPKSVRRMREQLTDDAFVDIQRRRAQTEGRIGILQNDFLGCPMLSKGFEHRELAVAWAILAHNLWVVARLPKVKMRKKAS